MDPQGMVQGNKGRKDRAAAALRDQYFKWTEAARYFESPDLCAELRFQESCGSGGRRVVTTVYRGSIFRWIEGKGYFSGRINGSKQLLHRVIYENEIGPIPPKHHIHHRDGNRTHNAIDNLVCLPANRHLALPRRREAKICLECGAEFLAAVGQNGRYCTRKCGRVAYGDRVHSKRRKRCRFCRSWFYQRYHKSGQHLYCSIECSAKGRRRDGEIKRLRNCACCGKAFSPESKDRRFCSHQCAGRGNAAAGWATRRLQSGSGSGARIRC